MLLLGRDKNFVLEEAGKYIKSALCRKKMSCGTETLVKLHVKSPVQSSSQKE